MNQLTKYLSPLFVSMTLVSAFGCASTPQREGTGEYIDDSVITTKVKAAILNEPGLKVAKINVETFKGAVQLSGFVNSQAEVVKAVEITRAVSGVKSVKDDMRVTAQTSGAGEYIEDSVITTKVKAAILGEPGLKVAEINVETFKGMVQLSGFVSSQADIVKAVEVARAVGGVKSVKNDMRVK